MAEEKQTLSETISNYEATRGEFAKTPIGQKFSKVRLGIWAVYLLPLLIALSLWAVQSSCTLQRDPLNFTGCTVGGMDWSGVAQFYLNTHAFGLIGIVLFTMVVKAFFMISYLKNR